MADELIDVCDKWNNLTGKQVMKSEAHKLGLWHRAAHVWIFNSKGEILLQLRAKDKAVLGGTRDVSAAGHIASGENQIISALRETEEEIGVKLTIDDLDYFMTRKTSKIYGEILNNEFKYIYLVKFDGDITGLQLQEEEVDAIQFFSIEKVLEDLEKGEGHYTPHGRYWFEVLEEIKCRLSI